MQIIIAMIVAIVWFALDPLHDGSLKLGIWLPLLSIASTRSYLSSLANLFTMYPRTTVSSRRLKGNHGHAPLRSIK